MTEEEFRQELKDEGYGEPEILSAVPGPLKELHTHDQMQKVMVTTGEFIMITDDGFKTYTSGDCYVNVAGTLHTEQFGSNGCTVLMARK